MKNLLNPTIKSLVALVLFPILTFSLSPKLVKAQTDYSQFQNNPLEKQNDRTERRNNRQLDRQNDRTERQDNRQLDRQNDRTERQDNRQLDRQNDRTERQNNRQSLEDSGS
ncbi:hypothetical protein [Gloeothece verrucosa]|uniref:Uncharacterized protein n=1 Tax=Gloeothece verrucosa (strain PCC 7822) TaxID=497965 RepID=E0UNQ6_GLOV7|nr:hypothetical protein [Gloeothece verrucosa]ADN18586.1 hypothetical protein Cyan7822_6948 [Gloeothece verrucosa PCC 7822]